MGRINIMVDTITTDLEPVPSRSAPSTFSERMDTLLGKLPAWASEANALAAGANANATTAAEQAELATTNGAAQVALAAEQTALATAQAEIAASQAEIASAIGNDKGLWSNLTGSLTPPASVYHDEKNWQLLYSVSDITTEEPGTSAAWAEVRIRSQIELPVITYPTTGTDNIGTSITVTGSDYKSLYGYDQSDAQIQVSEDSDFATTEIDTVAGSATTTFDITDLTILTTYYCRIRYQDSADRWSSWSTRVLFTTANVYIDAPTNTSPASLETNITETPELTSDAFECINGADTHASSDWEVYSDSGLTILVWSSYDDTSNLITATIPAGILNPGSTNYHWRCRHTGTTYGDSVWSTATKFTTQDQFSVIYGIALVSSGGGAGSWQMINENGNDITLTTTDFNYHPVWGGIEDVTIDSQAMVKIPKFYYKVGNLSGGDQTGKKAWLVSDSPVTGFTLHPAFMDGGVEIDQFYYGKYEATNDGGTKAGSAPGVAPLVSIDFPEMQSRCTARNTGGVDGFHMLNIHELSAVQMLCLIDNGGPDVQSSIGAGNTASSAAVNTGASNAVWRGIYELWGNVFCAVDGAQFDTAKKIKVFDQNGNRTYVNTNIVLDSAGGWITGMYDNADTGYDLKSMFLGKTTEPTETNGAFGDYQYAPDTSDNVCYHGGYWSSGSRAGLFHLNLYYAASGSGTSFGSRLAKV